MTTLTVQQNVGGYSGTIDTFLRESRPTNSYLTATAIDVDGVDSAGARIQGLLSFSAIFGNGPGQIPLGATITSATLTLSVSDATKAPVSFYRMVQDWTALPTLTWNSLGAGIQTDGNEALATADVSLGSLASGTQSINVAQSLQAWANGAANHGWLLSSGGSDGFAFSSSEGASAPILTVTYDIPSNPVPGLIVVESAGTTLVTEGGAGDGFSVALKAAPTSDVMIAITTSGPGDIAVVTSLLTFTSLNWDTPQTATLGAVDDNLIEGPETFSVTLTATSTDPGYNGLSSNVTVTVNDNDALPPPTPELSVVESGGTTVVTEGGAGDSLSIALKAAPTSNVTIAVTTSASGDIAVLTSLLTFTPLNWNTAQTATLGAVDDNLVEGPETFNVALTATSSDAGYNGLSSNVTVTVNDNDVAPAPGVAITQSGGTTVVTEGGTGDSLSIALNAAPTSDVTIAISTSGSSDINIAPTFLTFTSLNWNTAQTASLGAINDTLVEGPESFNVTLAATSADSGYNGLSSNVSVTVNDNDVTSPPLSPTLVAVHDATLYKAGDPSGYGCGDPSGLAYVPGLDLLFIVDSEHDEKPYFSSVNLFTTRLDGTFVESFSMRGFTREPTGIAYNPLNGLVYITDDDTDRIFFVDPLNPTAKVGEIDLRPLGITDAEDPAIDPVTGHIYMLDGFSRSFFELTATGGLVSHVILPSAISDAEGLAYDPAHDVFYIASGATRGKIFQTDHAGHILQTITLLDNYVNPITGSKPKIKGLELAPSSDPHDGNKMSLYAAEYGADQKADGRIFEIDLHDNFLFV